jgi:Spy/CpxP family protein refolding chaperone
MTARRWIGVITLAGACALAPLRLAAQATSGGSPPPGPKAFFHGHGGFGPPMMGDRPAFLLPMLLHGLSLSDAQRTQIRQIMLSDRSSFASLFQQLHQAEDALNDQILAPGTKQASDLAPQIQEITQLRQQLLQQGVQSMLQIRAVLTPDQLNELAQKKQRLTALRAEMRSLMGPAPLPPEAE